MTDAEKQSQQEQVDARQKIEKLKSDQEFRQKLTTGNPDAYEQWEDLHRQAYPIGKVSL